MHSRSGSFPPPSFLLPPSVIKVPFPFLKCPIGLPQQMYKVDRCLAYPLLPIRVGLTQKSSDEGMEPLESRPQFTLGQRRLTLFGSGTRTDFFPLFRVIIERSEIKVYYKLSEVSMVFYLCVVSVHSGRLRTDASLLLNLING